MDKKETRLTNAEVHQLSSLHSGKKLNNHAMPLSVCHSRENIKPYIARKSKLISVETGLCIPAGNLNIIPAGLPVTQRPATGSQYAAQL